MFRSVWLRDGRRRKRSTNLPKISLSDELAALKKWALWSLFWLLSRQDTSPEPPFRSMVALSRAFCSHADCQKGMVGIQRIFFEHSCFIFRPAQPRHDLEITTEQWPILPWEPGKSDILAELFISAY